jgi:hypothetical protein
VEALESLSPLRARSKLGVVGSRKPRLVVEVVRWGEYDSGLYWLVLVGTG